jgi:hypothetical protein
VDENPAATLHDFFDLWGNPRGKEFSIPGGGGKIYQLSNWNYHHLDVRVSSGDKLRGLGHRAFNLVCLLILDELAGKICDDQGILPGPEWLEITAR